MPRCPMDRRDALGKLLQSGAGLGYAKIVAARDGTLSKKSIASDR